MTSKLKTIGQFGSVLLLAGLTLCGCVNPARFHEDAILAVISELASVPLDPDHSSTPNKTDKEAPPAHQPLSGPQVSETATLCRRFLQSQNGTFSFAGPNAILTRDDHQSLHF